MKTTQQSEYAVDLRNVSVQRAQLMVLENITCAIPKAKISAIIGPNGAGKTTLLHAIMKFIPLAHGSCTILGDAIEKIRAKVAYVPQKAGVEWDFPATVQDVVLMGRFVHHSWWQSLTKDDYAHAYQALDAVDMLMYKHRPIGELSGGQQQRVFIARALAQDPEIYFLDEPFAGVDLATERSIMHILHGERDKGKSIVMVHHDLHSLYEYGDWALLLNKQLIKSGSIADVLHKDVIMQAYGRNNFLMDRP